MNRTLSTVIRLFLILTICTTTVFGNIDRMFDSFGAIECDDEMARLDNLALELQNAPGSRAYIFVYGGKRGTYKDEVRVRGARMKRYLIDTRGLSPDLIDVRNGGYRDSLTVEFWIIPINMQAPTASPTVDPKSVRFKKGKMDRYREPGCFPGKYLNRVFRHKAHAGS